MKVSADFAEGHLSMLLLPETEAEQRMVAAVIEQPTDADSGGYLDKSLISATLRYEGHFTNKRISSLRLNVCRPNKCGKEAE